MNQFPPYRQRSMLCAMLAIAASLPAAGVAQAQALHAPGERISDQAIVADHASYAAVQQRIRGLNDQGVRVGDYYLSKAQCWLDVSLHEYTRNDRSAFPQQALAQSAAIVGALEAGAQPNPGEQTPLLNGAARLREDLWERLASARSGPGFACAAQRIACAEVELAHAGNEYQQQGWRHANPYVQIAEEHVEKAGQAAANCPDAVPAAPPVCVAGPAPACAPAVAERISLSADALFRFDKWALPDLLPAGRAQIDDMMVKLDKVYAQISRIILVGHTDRLGTDRYNQLLSERRAATLRQYLVAQGFRGEIEARGQGESQQLAACEGVLKHAELIDCLQPNRRVDIEIVGSKR